MVGTRGARPVQPLSYDLRLPETAQADALRLLGASRTVINQALIMLWPRLDEFAAAGLPGGGGAPLYTGKEGKMTW